MFEKEFKRTVKLNFNELQEECKAYQFKENYFLPENAKYVIVHCDGRSFSKLIKNKFKKPFDENFVMLMNETAKYVSSKISGCVLSYVQSDEISFIIVNKAESQPFFGNRLCKMQSIIASMCTGKFISLCYENKIDNVGLIEFDCKVWSVPTYDDVIKWLIFRQKDCVRNSKLQTAQTYLSHKQLLNHSAQESIDLLKKEKGIDWSEEIETGCKIGRIVYKTLVEKTNDYGTFMRSVWDVRPSIYWDDKEQLEEFEKMEIIF